MLRTHRTTAKPCPSHPKAAVPRCCPGALSAVGEAAGGEQGRGARGSCSSRPPAAHHPGAHRAPLQPLASASAANPAPWGRGRHRHGPGRITAITPAEFPGEQGLSPPPHRLSLTTRRWKRPHPPTPARGTGEPWGPLPQQPGGSEARSLFCSSKHTPGTQSAFYKANNRKTIFSSTDRAAAAFTRAS